MPSLGAEEHEALFQFQERTNAGALINLGEAVQVLADPQGYISANFQDVLLQCYGGPAFASDLDRTSNAFRIRPPPSPSSGLSQSRGQEGGDDNANGPDASMEGGSGSGSSDTEPTTGSEPDHAVPIGGRRRRRRPRRGQTASTSQSFTAEPLPPEAWDALDGVSLQDELGQTVPTIKEVPFFMRAGLRDAFTLGLTRIRDTRQASENEKAQAWKLFSLTSRLLLAKPSANGAEGKEILLARLSRFFQGDWLTLLSEAHQVGNNRRGQDPSSPEDQAARRRETAVANVQHGELSRARQALTGAALAPGTHETLQQLTDPTRRPPHLERPVSASVLQRPPSSLRLNTKLFFEALRGARKGSAAGLSGMAASHLKPLLENEACMELLGCAASLFAAAQIPQEVSAALALARLTALSKPNGGVRGIATGDTFRRLVSRALAKQFAQTFNHATAPFQFALQTRAGTDCLAGLLRAATDLDETATVMCLDGVGAFDHVSRAAFLHKLQEVAPNLVPFVLQFYGRTSVYYWWDDAGTRHTILQGEGCEQGDALAPALFALAMHEALVHSQAQLQEGEFLAAFLDDIYLVTQPGRARAAFDSTTRIIQEVTAMRTNMGKCRMYNRTGNAAPPEIASLELMFGAPTSHCRSGASSFLAHPSGVLSISGNTLRPVWSKRPGS